MTEQTPTQVASRVFADAVMADPEQRARFEQMIKDTEQCG